MSWEDLATTFEDGDVLYGLDKGRKAAREAILKEQSRIKIKVTFLGCFTRSKNVDRIIIQNVITDSVFNVATASPHLKTGGRFYSSNKDIRKDKGVAADPKRAIGFRDYLSNHAKWNLEHGIPDEAVKGAGWKINKKGVEVSDMDRARKAWTRTSKAGLEYQTKNRGRKVHFILDGIKFDRVIKKFPGDVTSAEIRWLYRHRSDKQVTDNVVYWLAGDIMDPPWEWNDNRAAFSNYTPKSEKKEVQDDHSDASGIREAIGVAISVRDMINHWESKAVDSD